MLAQPIRSVISPEGCPDRDGEGFSDTTDMFPDDMDEWADSDGDGFGDNGTDSHMIPMSDDFITTLMVIIPMSSR